MGPIGQPRERKFTFVLTDDERAMLDALAQSQQRTSSDLLRVLIRDTYVAKFGDKPPKKPKR